MSRQSTIDVPSRADRRTIPAAQLSTTVLLLAVAGYFLLPVWWLVVSATKSNGDLFGTNGFWFGSSLHLADNVAKVFQHSDGAFSRWMLNSLLYSAGGALAATLIATMAGYALGKYPFRGREGVFARDPRCRADPTATARPAFVPACLVVGVVNTYWSVLIPSLVTPFGVYLARCTPRPPYPTSCSTPPGWTVQVSYGSSSLSGCG